MRCVCMCVHVCACVCMCVCVKHVKTIQPHLSHTRSHAPCPSSAQQQALAALTEHELYSRDSEEDSRTNLLSRRVDLWPSSIALHELVNGAKCVIGRMACQLEDCDAIRSYHDRALLQKGYSDALNWTVDLPRWSFDDVHAMSVWIALDDVHMG